MAEIQNEDGKLNGTNKPKMDKGTNPPPYNESDTEPLNINVKSMPSGCFLKLPSFWISFVAVILSGVSVLFTFHQNVQSETRRTAPYIGLLNHARIRKAWMEIRPPHNPDRVGQQLRTSRTHQATDSHPH